MLAMILAALGSSIAASGFMLLGISLAIIGDHDLLTDAGIAMMVGGALAAAVGVVMYRASEKKLEYARIR